MVISLIYEIDSYININTFTRQFCKMDNNSNRNFSVRENNPDDEEPSEVWDGMLSPTHQPWEIRLYRALAHIKIEFKPFSNVDSLDDNECSSAVMTVNWDLIKIINYIIFLITHIFVTLSFIFIYIGIHIPVNFSQILVETFFFESGSSWTCNPIDQK